MDESINIEEALISEWTTAVEALDSENIRELLDIRPDLLWTPLTPLSHLENDFAHFIQRLEQYKLLGTSIRPVYALHHILYDYGVPNDEWAVERMELVDFILKNTKGNELNTCFWGSEQNSVMHLAYFTNQSELIQQLKDRGALSDIPNKSGHMPTILQEEDESTNISQPEVKLLINKSKTGGPKDRPQANASDRFKRLRELAESPSANNKPTTERQNSTRRYFRPGHLEERKRRVLSEEEEAELKKQDLKRQKEVEQLAQRSAVRNNPLFKKFEEQQQQQQQQAKRAPSISAASAVRERKKLLGVAEQVRRTSRVINSLKDRSYVSTSVFRQAQEAEDATRKVNKLTLAQLRAGNSTIKEASPTTSDNEDEIIKQDKPVILIEKEKDITKKESKEINKLEEENNNGTTNSNINVTSNNVPDSVLEDNKLTNKIKKDSTTTSNLNIKSNNTNVGVTEDELESLSIGKLGNRGLLSPKFKTDDKKKVEIPSSKVKDIVDVHEHLNVEEEIKLHTLGKKFEVWKKSEAGQNEEVEYVTHGKTKSLDEPSITSSDDFIDTDKQKNIIEKEVKSKEGSTAANGKISTNNESPLATTPKLESFDEKSQLTSNNNNSNTLTKDTIDTKNVSSAHAQSRSVSTTKDEQPSTDNKKVISTAKKIELSDEQNDAKSKNTEPKNIIINASSTVSNLKSKFKDQPNEDTKTTKEYKPSSSAALAQENSDTTYISNDRQHIIEENEINDKKPVNYNEEKATLELNYQNSNNVSSSTSTSEISTPNPKLLINKSTEKKSSQPIIKYANVGQYVTKFSAADQESATYSSERNIKPNTESSSSLKYNSYSNIPTSADKEILTNSDEKLSFAGNEETTILHSTAVSKTNLEPLTNNNNLEKLETVQSSTPFLTPNEEEESFDLSIADKNNLISTDAKNDHHMLPNTISTYSNAPSKSNLGVNDKKMQPTFTLAENETSPIPTATNQLEPNHDYFSTDRSIKKVTTSKGTDNQVKLNEHIATTGSNHITADTDDDSSDFEDSQSFSANPSIMNSSTTKNYSENKEAVSTYLSPNTSSTFNEEKKEIVNHVRHLEINTNKGHYVIEEESDEDESNTPTMANPHTYQQQKEMDESSEDEETRREWESAYHGLMSNQQEAEFEDDILTHHNKTMAKGDDPRQSFSSDMDETSIIQALSYQNEARVDNWTSKQEQAKKRQSGSQRNHWSTGIQHVDTVKRASMMSKGGESIAASSEAGSEQWFDPDEEWNEQQQEEIRRQSMLAASAHLNTTSQHTEDDYTTDYYYNQEEEETYRHSNSSTNTSSEAYSYKNSNSTENTNLDEYEEDERKRYQQEIEEEEDDYYSTNLHASNQNMSKTRGESSYYNGGHSDNDQDEEGEIVVFMNQFSPPGENNNSRNIQKSMTSQESQDITTSFLNNSSKPSLIEHQSPKPLAAATITNFSTSTLSVNNMKREDDEISLIKVPSRTVDIADAGKQQEILPHDPNNPRVEDISHYMNKLPAFERNHAGREAALRGGSAFDAAAMEGGGGLENESVVIKRAISTSHPDGHSAELDRGIPNAHEIDSAFIMAEKRRASHEEGRQKISMGSIEANSFGKMYIGVSGAHHMLLPLPKEITYVRCVISDGEYEYMSRYEILGHQILMDYECVIDTRPGIIITVSLHVRPDYHVKPRTGWTKWFTSIRKQKEHLSGYVHPEDGAIGQTRFAVDHMVPGCYKKTYEAHFDCFNSWYARTTRERARREQFGDEEDFLKIVGKLNIEMLYLPVSNPSVQVPRSLRECDLTLKIRQWHDTCWQSGYLSTRRQGLKIWERHYYRLIGSQLIGYTSDGGDKQVYDHYNMSDVIRLSAAADKVIVTLTEDKNDDKVFGAEPIHANNHKGFFRLAFPDYYLDCVSDDLEESEEWVKTLKSMIGRIPLRLPFSD